MKYIKFPPRPELASLVECYYTWESAGAVTLDIESPPNACAAIAFNFGDPYYLSNQKYDRKEVPTCFISGQSVQNYRLHLEGVVGIVGIALKPASLYHLFQLPMFSVTDERIDLKDIDPEISERARTEIRNSTTSEERVDVLRHLMAELVEKSQGGNPYIQLAANRIFEEKGQTAITELLEEAPMSRRNFERKFLEEVGVSPKTFAKIRRFGYTCSLMAGDRNANLMDVLHRGGYYDQSHFIKDFKCFSGRTPRTYSRTNQELANHLDRMAVVEERLRSTSKKST